MPDVAHEENGIDDQAAIVQCRGMEAPIISQHGKGFLLGFALWLVCVNTGLAQIAFDERHTRGEIIEGPEPALLFKYRLFPAAEVTSTSVTAGDEEIESRATAYGENPVNTTALLVLVDTSMGPSNARRAPTMEPIKQAISEILARTTPRNLVGLYEFSNELTELTPLGSPFSASRAKLQALASTGLGTRLYLNASEAVKKLAATKADRKALLIFSDGKDEDTGYTLGDMLKTAADNDVIIMAVGVPVAEQWIPALGGLERAAKETSGFYGQMDVQSPPTGSGITPAQVAEGILASLDGGADVVADLRNVDLDKDLKVTLTLTDGQQLVQSIERSVIQPADQESVQEEGPDAAGDDEQETAQEDDAAAPVVPQTTAEVTADWMRQNLVWVLSGGGALLALIILALVAARGRKKEPFDAALLEEPLPEAYEPEALAAGATNPAIAWLVMQDANATRYPVTKTANRIGRRKDNDIIFTNDSVSGHHAELHMSREGSFSITDLGSGNGVVVNGKKVAQSPLRDGDIVDLGEVVFRFTLEA